MPCEIHFKWQHIPNFSTDQYDPHTFPAGGLQVVAWARISIKASYWWSTATYKTFHCPRTSSCVWVWANNTAALAPSAATYIKSYWAPAQVRPQNSARPCIHPARSTMPTERKEAKEWHWNDKMKRQQGCWTWNLVVPGSSPPPCHWLDLFWVALSSTPLLCCVNSQLVCHPPVGVFKHFMFISVIVKCY